MKATQMGTEAFITREKATQNLMDKEGLGARIVYNAQLLAGLLWEQGIAGIKTFAATLDEKSLARKVIMGTYDAAAVVAARAKTAITFLQTTYERISLAIKKQGLMLTIREAWKSIAGAAMSAFESAAKIPMVGWLLGAVAAGGAIALGASLMSKGDDVVSPGYGKRTLMAPEGAIALNDKDTVIAGTDLGGKGKGKGKSKLPCFLHQQGNCHYGDACRFSHDAAATAATTAGAAVDVAAAATDSSSSFFRWQDEERL